MRGYGASAYAVGMNDARNFDRVASDLEAIFGPAGVPVAPLPIGRTLATVRPQRPARGGRLLLIGAPLCAAVIGGLTLGYGSMPARSSRPVHVAPVRLAAVPAIGTTPSPAASLASLPTVPVEQTVETAQQVAIERPPASIPAVAEKAYTGPGPVRPARIDTRCPPGAEDDACIYADVRAADRRLRRAYRQATNAGVPRATLVQLSRRWDSALDLSLEAPDETIRRYDSLTDDLREAIAYETASRYD